MTRDSTTPHAASLKAENPSQSDPPMKLQTLFRHPLPLATAFLSILPENLLAERDPSLSSRWQQVNAHILETWDESKVTDETPQMPGSLELPKPYFSIHPNRNVLFGWDTFFTNVGLLLVDEFALYAKNATDNQLAEIEQIGFVPNASEPWAHNRSQTPFLSMMVRDVYEAGLADKEWLNQAYTLLRQEYEFWTDTSPDAIEDHSTPIPGLQRFSHHATEEEQLTFYQQIAGRFHLPLDLPPEEQLAFTGHWLAEAESGMDFTPRFENRAAHFIAVDLNANLYRYEKNFAWMCEELSLEGQPDWEAKAKNRQNLLTQYCWDEERGLFLDYDFVNHRRSKVASIATFYPLWTELATPEQAGRVVKNLPLFEHAYGLTICEPTEQPLVYQWDHPAGWPPIYFLVAKGLDQYGYEDDAQRVASKYLDVVTRNYENPLPTTYTIGETVSTREPGHVYEKYDTVKGIIYDAEYPSRPFHGWSYGVFVWCFEYLQQGIK
jgi:alpha,alpha-trehalase